MVRGETHMLMCTMYVLNQFNSKQRFTHKTQRKKVSCWHLFCVCAPSVLNSFAVKMTLC